MNARALLFVSCGLLPIASTLLHCELTAAPRSGGVGLPQLKADVGSGASRLVGAVGSLSLEAGETWTLPQRKVRSHVTFISFQTSASRGTIIDVGGVQLGLAGLTASEDVQLVFRIGSAEAIQWSALNYQVATGLYKDRRLATLPTLTVRLDPIAGVWDLFSGSRLIADSLPLADSMSGDGRITITAGDDGAWIRGVVVADENPIYEDANRNGIDDAFELKDRGGSLLAANAAPSDRRELAQRWKRAQQVTPAPVLHVQRLLPDSSLQTTTLER